MSGSGWRACGTCCLGFSLFAIAFLCIVGAIIRSGSPVIHISDEKRDAASHNCFVAAAIYAGFVGLSLICIFLPSLVCPKKRIEEHHVPILDEYRVQ